MSRLRSWFIALFVGLLVLSVPTAAAQSVASVVDQMRDQYDQQLETVDTYIVETNLYTSYHKKVTQGGGATYRTETRMKEGEGAGVVSQASPSSVYGFQFEGLKQHATYDGTETVNGTTCHVLRVDDPAKVIPEMSAGDAKRLTYYIDAERSVPARMVMMTTGQGRRGKPSTITVDLTDYRTVDGLTLPYRTEIQVDMDLSEQERKQMEQALKQMENMPKQQRSQMQGMMGGQMDMIKQMMSGEPIRVDVQDVTVNTELPDDVF
jgi:outer membrane lipoprotein-sorting protein